MTALFDDQTERAVLGLCMLAPAAALQLIASGVDDECFHTPTNLRMWRAIVALSDNQEDVTAEQVARAMSEGPDATDQDRVHVNRVLTDPSPASGLHNDAERLREMARRRRWQYISQLAAQAAATNDETLIAQVERLLATTEQSEDTLTPMDLGLKVVDWLSDTKPVGISTGLRDLDAAIGGGWRPGDMTVLAAYSGLGKSTLLDTMLTTAARARASCHVYVNEMNAVDRGLRMVARESRVVWKSLALRKMGDRDHIDAQRAASRLPFGITDCSMWTAERIARHARASHWKLWAVDLVSNMGHRDEQELSQIINTLASAARNTGSHCILITQLNRARNVGDTLPRPVARDIRGSGMFEAQARNVLMLHREQTATGSGSNREITTAMEGMVFVEKATHGVRGASVPVYFHPEHMMFRALDTDLAAA
jgi:replicative DNA helicase